jgi:hypothetical protein
LAEGKIGNLKYDTGLFALIVKIGITGGESKKYVDVANYV